MTWTKTQALELFERFGVRPSRALGQNFVVDPNTVRRIVRVAGVEPGEQVVEVGPGIGSLTLALVEAGAQVTAVELDRHLLAPLGEVTASCDPPVRLVHGDALEVDWDELLGPLDPERPWRLVANLPYNVSTTLVLQVLEQAPQVTSMLVMVQLESGERLAAQPGSKAYGIPSLKVAYWADAKVVGRVSPSVFVPRPRVDSALVRIDRRAQVATAAPRQRLFALIDAGFGQRRKMLRRSLEGLVTEADLAAAGLRPEARAEELTIDQWGALALAVPGAA